MYAIVQHGGHQYRVEPGKTFEIERIEAEAGETVTFENVLFLGGETTQIGAPNVAGASVSATVIGEVKGEKIVVQKYKPKKRYKIRTGHRQRYTQLKVEAITA